MIEMCSNCTGGSFDCMNSRHSGCIIASLHVLKKRFFVKVVFISRDNKKHAADLELVVVADKSRRTLSGGKN